MKKKTATTRWLIRRLATKPTATKATTKKTIKQTYHNDGICPVCKNHYPKMTTKGFARHVRSSHPKIYDAGRKLWGASKPVYMWDFGDVGLHNEFIESINKEIIEENSKSKIADGTWKATYSPDQKRANTNSIHATFTVKEGKAIEHPSHYNQGSIECIDAIRAALTPEEFQGFCKGNALKYIWREKHKNQTEDLKKAEVYLRWTKESEEMKGK